MVRWIAGLLLALAMAPAAAQEADGTEPEFWEVTGLAPAATLTLRQEAAVSAAVVADVARGTVLRNLGCTGEGGETWCEVELADGGPRGWASGRYLAAYAEPPPGAGTGRVPGIPPTGTVFCQLGADAAASCPFVVRRMENGGMELVVTFADGFQRLLEFQGGEVFSPDPTDEVTATRGDGTTVVEVNAVERIEVPDAVVMPE